MGNASIPWMHSILSVLLVYSIYPIVVQAVASKFETGNHHLNISVAVPGDSVYANASAACA